MKKYNADLVLLKMAFSSIAHSDL